MKDLTKTFLSGVAGALTVVVLVAATGPLALRDDGVQFPDGSVQRTADQRRAYYLTNSTWDGASALSACASGYHMASLWEIYETSTLRYANEQPDAFTQDDSGEGPPAGWYGWVRTGGPSSNLEVNGEGRANCLAWTSNDAGDFGTQVKPKTRWWLDTVLDPWRAVTAPCGPPGARLWCVED